MGREGASLFPLAAGNQASPTSGAPSVSRNLDGSNRPPRLADGKALRYSRRGDWALGYRRFPIILQDFPITVFSRSDPYDIAVFLEKRKVVCDGRRRTIEKVF